MSTPAQSLCGISCRHKATPARSRGPEAVGAFTPLMWQATEHGEAGFILAPAPCYWSWTKTRTRCRQLGDIVCKCANQIMEAGFVATLQSWFQHTLYPLSHWCDASPVLRNLHRLAVSGDETSCAFAVSKGRQKPWPSAEETVALQRITPNQRKAICSVLEIMS